MSRTTFKTVPLREVPTSMGCEEKARLVRDYDNATLAFSNAVQEMHRKIRTSPRDEYQRLERISHEARVKSEQTRLALEQRLTSPTGRPSVPPGLAHSHGSEGNGRSKENKGENEGD